MADLTGNSITALNRTNKVLSDDLLVCAQRDEYVCTEKNTVAVESHTVVSKLIEDIAAMRNFGSMLCADKTSFSPASHNHNSLYNKLSIDFYRGHPSHYSGSQSIVKHEFTGYPVSKSKIDSYLSIGNLFVDGTLSTVYVPMSCVNNYSVIPWQIAEPEVGTIKLGVIPDKGDIDYRSDDFDGWLYPDGSTYDLSDFALSDKIDPIYGTGDGKTFTLPLLSNFIRLNGKMQGHPKLTSRAEGQNALVSHQHTIDIDATGSITVIGEAPYSEDVEKTGTTVHRGTGYTIKEIKVQIVAINPSTGQRYFKEITTDVMISHIPSKKYNDDDTVKAARKKYGLPQKVTTAAQIAKCNKWVDEHTMYHSEDIELSCKCDINASNVSIQECSDDSSSETYPDYFDLQIMLYVGKRDRS